VEGLRAGQSVDPGYRQSYKSANKGTDKRETTHRRRLRDPYSL